MKKNFPACKERRTAKEVWAIIGHGLITLGMPLIIIGGVLGGWFTATESANIACVYSLLLGLIVYHNYHPKDFALALEGVAHQMANIFLIISFASVFAWIMGRERIPEQIAALLLSLSDNKYVLLFLINVFLLIVGMFMDTGAAIILFAPILAPILYGVGVHPVHFAVVMLMNLTLGLITPPVGVVLYSATAVGKRRFEGVVQAMVPFLIISFAALALVTLAPGFSLFLPRICGFL